MEKLNAGRRVKCVMHTTTRLLKTMPVRVAHPRPANKKAQEVPAHARPAEIFAAARRNGSKPRPRKNLSLASFASKLFWPGRGHGYPIPRRATANHTFGRPAFFHPGANLQEPTGLPSRGPVPSPPFRRGASAPSRTRSLPACLLLCRCLSRPWPPSAPPPAPAAPRSRLASTVGAPSLCQVHTTPES